MECVDQGPHTYFQKFCRICRNHHYLSLNRQFILITYNRCQKDKKKFRERARCCESNTIFKSGPHTHTFFLKCGESICQIKSIIVKKNAKLAVRQEIEKRESREFFYIFRNVLKNDELKSVSAFSPTY